MKLGALGKLQQRLIRLRARFKSRGIDRQIELVNPVGA